MAVHLAKGTRDFLPAQMATRIEVMDTVRGVFERFGFEPLQTPAFERIETLMGKYGDEGEQLIYKILKRGRGAETGQCDLALRYDLTVPLARVMAMHSDLRLPFKRYQMQPVWRADRPQKGRFREFWQCDVDIVGSTSPVADAECIAVVAASLEALGFGTFTTRLNDRRILRALTRAIGAEDREVGILVAIDKLDKIGRDGVSNELTKLGLSEPMIAALWEILDVPLAHSEALSALHERLDAEGLAGVATLRAVLAAAEALGVDPARMHIDPTLARGLGYYTGPVFETVVQEPRVGSLSGGGRYDDLIGLFSRQSPPAVGVSLGLERIIAVLDEQRAGAVPPPTAQVLVTVMDEACHTASLALTRQLRQAGINAELYLGSARLKSQMKHANARAYPWVAILGPDEVAADQVTLRHLATGTQATVPITDAAQRIHSPEPAPDTAK